MTDKGIKAAFRFKCKGKRGPERKDRNGVRVSSFSFQGSFHQTHTCREAMNYILLFRKAPFPWEVVIKA